MAETDSIIREEPRIHSMDNQTQRLNAEWDCRWVTPEDGKDQANGIETLPASISEQI